jgi:uncharacterized protein (TIGR00730 family)
VVSDIPSVESPSYRKAYEDIDFLNRDELRSVRLELELLKADIAQREHRIASTIVVFGSARIADPEAARLALAEAEAAAASLPGDPAAEEALERNRRTFANSRYYQEAREFSRIVSAVAQVNGHREYVIVTGGGPGIMEAANRGAHDVGAKSIGLNIVLPHEQRPNPYVTPDLCFQFRYFAIRKMHFLMRAKALVAFPGGYGTFDELFETLTLIQTGKVPPVPVVLFGREFWDRVIRFDALAREGMITAEELEYFSFAETAAEAWKAIAEFHARSDHRMPEI